MRLRVKSAPKKVNKCVFWIIVYACCSVISENLGAASPDWSALKDSNKEAFQVMFSESGGLRAYSETKDNGVTTKTSLSSSPATLKEVLIASENAYRILTLFIGDRKKLIESYQKDGEREYLKTLEIHASNGERFTLRFRDGKYVVETATEK